MLISMFLMPFLVTEQLVITIWEEDYLSEAYFVCGRYLFNDYNKKKLYFGCLCVAIT